MQRRHAMITLAAPLLGAAVTPLAAQDNTLRLVVPYPPGGAADTTARIIAAELGPRLQRPVVVDNRLGPGGRIPIPHVRALPPAAAVPVIVNPALTPLELHLSHHTCRYATV